MEVNYFTIFYWFCHISTWIHHGFISPVSISCTLNDSFFQLKTKNPILLARYLSQLSSYLQEVVNPKFTFDIDRPYTFQSILLAFLLVREIDSWLCETKSSPLNLYNMSPSDIGLWSMVPQESLLMIFRNQLEDLESILGMSLKWFRSHLMYQRPYKTCVCSYYSFFIAGMRFISNIILLLQLSRFSRVWLCATP